MGWCRICNVDCESVQGLEMHGQTREHQWMAMNMVNNIKHTSARIAMLVLFGSIRKCLFLVSNHFFPWICRTSNAHSGLGEASKLGSSWSHGWGSKH